MAEKAYRPRQNTVIEWAIALWRRRVAVIVSLCLAAGACAPQIRFMRYTSSQYAPTTDVEILQIKPPDRRFKEIGLLSIRLHNNRDENAVLYLVERAREIGADAIVILGEISAGSVAMPVGTMFVAVPLRDLQALAIRYE